MKALKPVALGLLTSTLAYPAVTLADAHESAAPRGFVETFTCQFLEGKSMADLEKAIDKFNRWADENDGDDYGVYILQPDFTSAGIEFDYGWLGGASSAKSYGKLKDEWLKSGGDIAEDFDEVSDCSSHTAFTVINTKAPADWENWTSGPTRFSDCKMADGLRVEEATDILRKWGEYQTSQGHTGGHWMFFPHYGEDPKAEYDFKLVMTDASYTELGERVDRFWADGGANEKARKLAFGRMTCDTPRVYLTKRYRLSSQN